MRTIFAGYNPQSTAGWKFRLQDLLVDYDTRQIFVGKKEIDLTQTEYNIMAFLSVHAGKVLTYAEEQLKMNTNDNCLFLSCYRPHELSRTCSHELSPDCLTFCHQPLQG